MSLAASRTARGGSVAVIMAVCIVTLLIFAGLAVDWTYVRTSEFELQNAVDASAHAALIELRRSGDTDKARELAVSLAEMNTAAGTPVHLTDEQIEFGEWSYDDGSFNAASAVVNGVRVTANRSENSVDGPISLFFGPIFGHNAAAVAQTAVGAYRSRDIMLSIDISTSMLEEMNDAVDAAVGFAAAMETRSLPNDRVGLNVFKSSATTITDLKDVGTYITSIKKAWDGDGKSNIDSTKTSGVTNCWTTYCKNKSWCGAAYSTTKPIPGKWMPACQTMGPDGVYGGSNQGAGLLAAHSTLSTYDTLDNTQVIVFISDGYPSCPTGGSACVAAREVYATQQADSAYADGINIFTISLNSTKSTHQTTFMASLARGYGKAYETPKSTDLAAILEEIEEQIPIALVE